MKCCLPGCMLAVLLACSLRSGRAAEPEWAGTAEEAFQASTELGCPLFVVVTGAGCGPCLALKQELRGFEQEPRPLRQFVVLELDIQSDEFRAFQQQHPGGFTGSVPMVYLYDASGEQRYAKAGLVGRDDLRNLVEGAQRGAGPPLTREEVARCQARLTEVRSKARAGQLVAAWHLVQPVASRVGTASVLQLGRKYDRQLVEAMDVMLRDLDAKLAVPDQAHEAAVRVAVLYVQSAEIPAVHARAGEILQRHEQQPPTRAAILQAKYLVRARIAEQRRLRDEAIVSYRQILDIDRDSPIGLMAEMRLPGIQSMDSTSTAP